MLLAAGGCGGGSEPQDDRGGSVDLARQLTFTYTRHSDEGAIDQLLTIFSKAEEPVAVTARFDALDADGKALPDVRTRGIYGTERGDQVLMPGWNHDILRFEGDGAADVRDVRVVGARADSVDAEITSDSFVDAVAIDSSGGELEYDRRALLTSIKVENDLPGPRVDVRVRVVVIVWGIPEGDEPQQALEVLKIGDLIAVPANERVTVVPTQEQLATIHEYRPRHAISIKAYYSR